MRVLLIEDDSATAQSIELMLKSESFNVYTTDLGEEGIDLGKIYDYDIILLDLNLPDMSGFEVLRSLRVSKVKTPILILSGLAGIEDKVRGLGFGADDYMTKPFHKDELVARIHAIVRRSKGHAQSVINTGDLCVNLDTKTVEVNGARVHLTGKEYQMLELLSLRKGTTLTKEMFLNHLYGGMDEPELKIIDVFICKLRVSRVKTPILILSSLAGIEDKIQGLGFGADDYMTKPFHKNELVARIRAIVRRSKGHAQSVIQTDDLVVNLDTKMIEIDGARVHLTPKNTRCWRCWRYARA